MRQVRSSQRAGQPQASKQASKCNLRKGKEAHWRTVLRLDAVKRREDQTVGRNIRIQLVSGHLNVVVTPRPVVDQSHVGIVHLLECTAICEDVDDHHELLHARRLQQSAAMKSPIVLARAGKRTHLFWSIGDWSGQWQRLY